MHFHISSIKGEKYAENMITALVEVEAVAEAVFSHTISGFPLFLTM